MSVRDDLISIINDKFNSYNGSYNGLSNWFIYNPSSHRYFIYVGSTSRFVVSGQTYIKNINGYLVNYDGKADSYDVTSLYSEFLSTLLNVADDSYTFVSVSSYSIYIGDHSFADGRPMYRFKEYYLKIKFIKDGNYFYRNYLYGFMGYDSDNVLWYYIDTSINQEGSYDAVSSSAYYSRERYLFNKIDYVYNSSLDDSDSKKYLEMERFIEWVHTNPEKDDTLTCCKCPSEENIY